MPGSALLYGGQRKEGALLIKRDGEILRGPMHRGKSTSVTEWSMSAPTVISLM